MNYTQLSVGFLLHLWLLLPLHYRENCPLNCTYMFSKLFWSCSKTALILNIWNFIFWKYFFAHLISLTSAANYHLVFIIILVIIVLKLSYQARGLFLFHYSFPKNPGDKYTNDLHLKVLVFSLTNISSLTPNTQGKHLRKIFPGYYALVFHASLEAIVTIMGKFI